MFSDCGFPKIFKKSSNIFLYLSNSIHTFENVLFMLDGRYQKL